MGRWYTGEPRLVGADFIHPLPAGARIVGELFYRSLQDGFNGYKLRQLKETAAGAAGQTVDQAKPVPASGDTVGDQHK